MVARQCFSIRRIFLPFQKDALTNILSVNNKSPRRNQFWAQISQCFREIVPRHGQSWKSHVIARFFEGRNAFSCDHLLYTRKPVWSSSLSSKHLLTVGESLLSYIYKRVELYEVRQTTECRWEVKFLRDQEDNRVKQEMESDGRNSNDPFGFMFPKFDRIRTVTLLEDDWLKCSCCSFESRGMPCVPTAAILNKSNPNWDGFLNHNCSLCWWKAWNMFSYNPSYPAVSQFLSIFFIVTYVNLWC